MKTSIQFHCKEQAIQAKFYSASGAFDPFPTLLLLPGFPGSEDDVLGLGEALSAHGLNVLTFNYRGTYQSEGEYSLRNTQEDIQAAFDFLRDQETVSKYLVDSERLVLGGYSYGGGMGLIYAANHLEVSHVFSIAGTDHGEFAREYQSNAAFSEMIDKTFDALKHPSGPVRFPGKTIISQELLPDPDPYDLVSHTAGLTDRDVLLMGGWDDPYVTIENHVLPCYRKLKELGAEKAKICVFQDDHAFERSRTGIMEVVLNWVSAIFG